MKFVFALCILCLAVVAISAGKSSKKSDYQPKWNEDVEDLKFSEESPESSLKKQKKDHKHHHHHHHHAPTDKSSHKSFGKYREQEKKQKHVAKSSPHEIPAHEAELQADINTNKKHLKDQYAKYEKEDLHLQDLSLEAKLKQEESHSGKSHQNQRGHHKVNQHVAHKKAPKHDIQVEEKLFDDQAPRENSPKPSPPVLEDSFEALNEEAETKKHSKKATKHKKAYQKGKKDKKNKKEKKQKDKKEKQKW